VLFTVPFSRNWDQNTIPVPTPIAAAHQPGQERGGEQAEKSVQIRQVTGEQQLFLPVEFLYASLLVSYAFLVHYSG
jgi:hypothetical protein